MRRRTMSVARYSFAGDGHARREQGTLVGFVFQRNPDWNRLETLEPRRWFEIRALLATMQLGVALRASAGEIGAGG